MSNVIELNGINKIYPGAVETQVLFDVNLKFERGSCNALVGESGSGKSTLLNILGTLDNPSSGEVIINGMRADLMSKNKLAELRNETIGFVFQFHYLLPEFTALENVLIPYLIRKKKPRREVSQRVDELFNLMGISKWKKSMVTKLSGGQQQRVAIARALVNNPDIILADEPTGNLDSDTTDKICSIFREINQKYGTTFIIVTHDLKVAGHTDRIVEIKDGKIIADTSK